MKNFTSKAQRCAQYHKKSKVRFQNQDLKYKSNFRNRIFSKNKLRKTENFIKQNKNFM